MPESDHTPQPPIPTETPLTHRGWTGIDLDGTLAHYDGWRGPDHIGEPVAPMMRKVHKLISDGERVKIFTARAGDPAQIPVIKAWLERHGLAGIEITNVKDFTMKKLYDDRCVFVFPNQGITHEEHEGYLQASFFEVAKSLGVKVKTGMQFGEVADECARRARAMTPNADAAENIRALVDAAVDGLGYVQKATKPNDAQRDLARALVSLNKALLLLNTLAGEKK